jgi:hypothetical protein
MKAFSNHSTPDLQLIKLSLTLLLDKCEKVISDPPLVDITALKNDSNRMHELISAINDELKSR